MMKRAKAIIFWVIMIVGVFILLRAFIGDYMLKKNGVCAKAILINEQNRVRSQKATLLYEFNVNGKYYKGNSLEENLTRVGDSIYVVYLESFPSINKPLKYFEVGKIKCNCNK